MLHRGSRLGAYEIADVLGAGGMGEVYRARDTRLNRDVAIKILPDAFASNADRVARFTREAQALGALNHQHIAQIYGVEEGLGQDGGPGAIVMELVDGETLAHRIARGPVPIDEALPIARDIAEALEAAHDAGIIHRDLKPANIKVRPDGTVKVLDFGLAKVREPATGESALTESPTVTSPVMTHAGVILGTAAYMSPEQARGKAVDKRTDIWAFGCVLYEMLAGRPAFSGESITDVLSVIVKAEPDWTALPGAVPASVSELLRWCLRKDPRERLRDIGDANPLLRLEAHEPRPRLRPRRRRETAAWITAAAAIAASLLVWAYRPVEQPSSRRVSFTITPPAGTLLFLPAGRLAISPDGARLAFVVRSGTTAQLAMHDFAGGTTTLLPMSDGIISVPFWSPDGQSVAFMAEGDLKRIHTQSGNVQTICAMPVPIASNPLVSSPPSFAMGVWDSKGFITFSVGSSLAGTGHGLFRVPATGGRAAPFTALDASLGETEHAFPEILPDGKHLTFLVRSKNRANRTVVGSLDNPAGRRTLTENLSRVATAARHGVFARDGVLYAQRMDRDQSSLVGEPIALANDIIVNHHGWAAFAVALDGSVLVYEPAGGEDIAQFTWVDASGREVGTAGPSGLIARNFDLSPDGRRLAFSQAGDLWALDLASTTRLRLTSDPHPDADPVWSPDSARVVFASFRLTSADVYAKRVDDVQPESTLYTSATESEYPEDWSPDGKYIAVVRGIDLAAISVADGTVIPLTNDTFIEDESHFSPNGKWIAYNSNESGSSEVYVMPFPPTGRKWIVSSGGGAQPRWRRDGRALYYLSMDGTMMSVTLDPATALPTAAPARLFQTGIDPVYDNHDQYDVSADGRFLLLKPVGERHRGSIAVVVNWAADLTKN